MPNTTHNPSRTFAVLPGVLAAVLAVLGGDSFAEDAGYREPDPKVIAQAETIAASLKAAPSRQPRTVLIYGISFGPHRTTIRTARQVFTLLGEKTGAFKPVVSDDLANFEADKLKQFDAVIFANTTGEVFCRPADKEKFDALAEGEKRKQEEIAARLVKNLDDYVRAGGGFMGIHSATDTLKNQKAYGDMIGAVFSQHPWGPKEAVTIKVEDADHALAKGVFEKAEFKFHDEIYEFREPYDRKLLHVILSVDPAKSDKPNRPLRRTDGDYPIAWVRSHGKGRVFYCSLGHATSAFADPAVLKFWLRGVQFAAGDIDAATTPSRQLQPGESGGRAQ